LNETKTIHSRANKNVGDLIEDGWEITAKKVIAEPYPGDRDRNLPPRFGIYEYEVKRIASPAAAKRTRARREQEPERAPEPNVGGTRREASTGPLTVRRIS
jgi:hypothetical protein